MSKQGRDGNGKVPGMQQMKRVKLYSGLSQD